MTHITSGSFVPLIDNHNLYSRHIGWKLDTKTKSKYKSKKTTTKTTKNTPKLKQTKTTKTHPLPPSSRPKKPHKIPQYRHISKLNCKQLNVICKIK